MKTYQQQVCVYEDEEVCREDDTDCYHRSAHLGGNIHQRTDYHREGKVGLFEVQLAPLKIEIK